MPPCTSPISPTAASRTSVGKASTPATSPRRWSTSATPSRSSAASRTRSSTSASPLHQLPSLDLWNDHFPGRFPGYWELKTKADWAEALSHLRGTFGEPLAFSMRAKQALKSRRRDFDLVHDNQCLGYSILGIEKMIPTIVTLHHPITRDRALEMAHTDNVAQDVLASAAGTTSSRCRAASPAACRGSSSSARTRSRTSTPTWASASTACAWCRSASILSCSRHCRMSPASRAG